MSESAKKRKSRCVENAKMQLAVDAVAHNTEKPEGQQESMRAIARRYNVRAVMAAFHHHAPTRFDLEDDTHTVTAAGPSRNADQPTTPLRRARDPNIDPALYTPSKRTRLMTTTLAGTSSGSFLVSDAVINSQNSILPPMPEGPPSIPKPNFAHLDPTKPDPNDQTNSQLIARMEQLTADLALAKQHIAARDGIIEGTHAQLVVQNFFVLKQNEALHLKEN
jgi:hypothetical protein